jgi:hypothetical protein
MIAVSRLFRSCATSCALPPEAARFMTAAVR